MSTIPQIKLNDGNKIPQFGLGVYQVSTDKAVETVLEALQAGYRHIDTAEMYGNEQQVGDAIKQSGIDRAEIFITSKLNNGLHKPDDARKAFTETLEKLGTDYIDLFLIHWPLPGAYDGDFVSTWKTLCEFKQDGRAKSVGVSNFQVPHLERLASETSELPAVNQIELHPYFQNREVAAYCAEHNIAVEAWSPIAQGKVLDDPTISKIAEATGKSTAQVVLRWHIQKGYIVFPKSSNAERMRDNINIFDFQLTDEQVSQIDGLDKGEAGRTGPNPDQFNYIP